MRHALIVDDEPDTLQWMSEIVKAEGYTVATADSLRHARLQLVRQQPDLLLTDLLLPDGNGTDLVDDLDAPLQTEVVVITGNASVSSAINAVRIGATDYLVKPVDLNRLLSILRRQPQASELKNEIGELRGELRKAGRFGHMLGASATMQRLYDNIARIAPTSATVLIRGEPGTGKQLVARTVHDLSRRRRAPFVVIDCGAGGHRPLEGEIFGLEKSGLGGSERQHRGGLERAQGGTVFLADVGSLTSDLQLRLLRAMETGEFTRTAASQTAPAVPIDVRILASTSRDLGQLVEAGQFRADLHARLNAFHLDVPPLAEREHDVELLAAHFLDEFNRHESSRKVLPATAVAELARRKWPGNVRELRSHVHRVCVLASEATAATPLEPEQVATNDAGEGKAGVVTIRVGTPLDEVERRVTMATLERCGFVKRIAAEVLGISLKTLYNRLEVYATKGYTITNRASVNDSSNIAES